MTVFIKGGRIVNAEASFIGDVILKDGKISKVGTNLEVPAGAEVKDSKDYDLRKTFEARFLSKRNQLSFDLLT